MLTLAPGVKEGQHLPARIHRIEKPRHHGRNQGFGQIVERGPQQNHIEHAAGEVERMCEKALDVPDRVALLVEAGLPVSRAGVVHHIGQEDAVAHAGQEVDVGRRCVADIEHTKALVSLKALAQHRPAPGVAQAFGSAMGYGRARGGSGWTALLLFVEPTADHPHPPSGPANDA